MDYQPLISIVTIVYNDYEGLKKTYESVLSQSYPNMEYIIIDGDSSDGSSIFIEQHQDKLAYWVSEKDKGIADAFNKGIRAAKGQWIILLNAADTFQDGSAIKRMIPYLESNQDADIVYGKMKEISAEGKVGGKVLVVPFQERVLKGNAPSFTLRLFITKKFFEDNGLFSPEYKIAMDYEIFLRKKDLKAVFANEDVTFMETGGTSQVDPSKAYREVNLIKKKHLAKSDLSLAFDYYENMLRYRISKFKQRLIRS